MCGFNYERKNRKALLLAQQSDVDCIPLVSTCDLTAKWLSHPPLSLSLSLSTKTYIYIYIYIYIYLPLALSLSLSPFTRFDFSVFEALFHSWTTSSKSG